jgi:hypothetical protein
VEFTPLLNGYWNKPRVKNNLILHFNFQLDKKTKYFSLNESSLEIFMDQLESLIQVKDGSYWLTLARIYELALLCAENYANNGELTLVGDLLLNPRLILIHIKGKPRPIVKKRHTPLTEQFRSVPDVIQWLKTETSLETKKEAVIPYLHQKIERSGYFCQEYFDFMNGRQKKIVDLTLFLSFAKIFDSLSLYNWLQKASPQDRELAQSKFCQCNLKIYSELGRQVRESGQGLSMPVSFKKSGSVPIPPEIPRPWREQPSINL